MTQDLVQMPEGRRGSHSVPLQIQLACSGQLGAWIDCAGAGVDVRNLRKWRKHPRKQDDEQSEAIQQLKRFCRSSAKAGIKLGLDERVKGYTAVMRSQKFKILKQIVDQQQREQIEAIKAQLCS